MPYKYVRFEPVEEWHGIKTDKHVSNLRGLIDVEVRKVETAVDDKRAVWRMYEDRRDDEPYVIASDQADGDEDVKNVGDWSVAIVGRRKDKDHPGDPVICCKLRSSLPTVKFAREVLFAARYYGNALLAPESVKGAANAVFGAEADEWPWWF